MGLRKRGPIPLQLEVKNNHVDLFDDKITFSLVVTELKFRVTQLKFRVTQLKFRVRLLNAIFL